MDRSSAAKPGQRAFRDGQRNRSYRVGSSPKYPYIGKQGQVRRYHGVTVYTGVACRRCDAVTSGRHEIYPDLANPCFRGQASGTLAA